MSDVQNTATPVPPRFCPMCEILVPATEAECPNCHGPLMLNDPDDLTGRVIDGRYTVMERLGKGGMGVVYRARQRFLDRDVALKVLRSEMAADTMAVRRFLQEAKAASGLRNPHTVNIIEFGSTVEGTLYFTMELLSGWSLRELIEREGALSPERVVEIGVQVCESLAEAHDQGIWHRDLKPDNIYLVDNPQQKDFVKVLDFGIAKVSTQQTQLTSTGAICGTPQYMSPEQAKGIPLDGRSDLYSLGIVLYEALCGCAPFEASTPIQMLMAHITMEPPAPTVRCPERRIPKPVEEVVMRVLAKEPADRPSSARELARALTASLERIRSAAQGSSASTAAPVHSATAPLAQGAAPLQAQRIPTPASAQPVALPSASPRGSPEALAATVQTPYTLREEEALLRRGRRWVWLGAVGVGLLLLATLALVFRPWEPAAPNRSVSEAAPGDPGAAPLLANPAMDPSQAAGNGVAPTDGGGVQKAAAGTPGDDNSAPSSNTPQPSPAVAAPGEEKGTATPPAEVKRADDPQPQTPSAALAPVDVQLKPATQPKSPVQPAVQPPVQPGADKAVGAGNATVKENGKAVEKTGKGEGTRKSTGAGTKPPSEKKTTPDGSKEAGSKEDSDFVPIRTPVTAPATPNDDFVPIQTPKK